MNLDEMEITWVRNLQKTKVSLHPSNNLIIGPNGSGKTSLLEAIYLLGRAKSFRTEHIKDVIQQGSQELMVFGRVQCNDIMRKIGLRRDHKSKGEIRIDGQKAHTVSELARLLPILLITPLTMELLTGPPSARRSYLDWIMFHVKPNYQETWLRYQRALKQRNAALRHHLKLSEIETWDSAVEEFGERIACDRDEVFPIIQTAFQKEMGESALSEDIALSLERGFSDNGLAADLIAYRDRDIKQGHTTIGPHRGEIGITLGANKARAVLSRGQTKLAVWALMSAALHTKRTMTGQNSLVLVDDVGAELDPKNREWILDRLASTDSQTFITATDSFTLPASMGDYARFHVKHGMVQEVV